jgi:hypothetical protein
MENDMTYRARRSGYICALLMLLAVLPGSTLAAPGVVLISGTGYGPSSLTRGQEVAPNSVVTADASTIVVLRDTWSMGNNEFCVEYVILRGRQYRVPARRPSSCDATGSGNELGSAMAGQQTLAQIRALQFSDPKADDPTPPRLARLQRDLYELAERAAAEEREAAARRESELQRERAARERARGEAAAAVAASRERELQRERAARESAQREAAAADARREREVLQQRREAARRAAEARAATDDNAAQAIDPESECRLSVQDKVPWNSDGETSWYPENAARLCAGTSQAREPGACFVLVLHRNAVGDIPPGWTWAEALDLCEGTSDARRTLDCYTQRVNEMVPWQHAIEACSVR